MIRQAYTHTLINVTVSGSPELPYFLDIMIPVNTEIYIDISGRIVTSDLPKQCPEAGILARHCNNWVYRSDRYKY
jgi:hypothetical protein